MISLKRMPRLYRKLLFIMLLVTLVYTIGTGGYYFLVKDYSLLSAVYMTTITLSTVGYGEVGSVLNLDTKTVIFTIFLILGGIFILGYAITSITSIIIEGEIKHTFRDRKMTKKISKMKNHIILCGHGRLGSHAAGELEFNKKPYVVIEDNPEAAEKLKEKNIPCVQGNATEDEVLIEAGIEHAQGLIAALAHDTDNLFVTLTARRLNRDLEIISRADYESSIVKLESAGANNVILPAQIAGRRMACVLINPEVASFLDTVIETADMDLSLQQIEIPKDSILDGVLISDAKIPNEIRIIGLKSPGRKIIVNPQASQRLEAGVILIVLGENDPIHEYRKGL